ncbi:MAG: hypothetical protein WDZ69_03460 [Candidatus Pacearchaeota archaeon]
MSKQKVSRKEAAKEIDEFFNNIKNKTPGEVKKIKKLAMGYNLKLREKKKLFCRKCLAPYRNPKIRIKEGKKTVACEDCSHTARWKIKTS